MSLTPVDYRKTALTHRRGLSTDRPDPTTVLPGTLYFSEDLQIVERSDGIAWEIYSITPETIPFVFYYRANTTSIAYNDPGAGKIKWNNANQLLATSLYVDVLTNNGFDAVMFYKMVGPQDRIIIQDGDVSQRYQVWDLTGPVVELVDWFEVPVTLVSYGSTGLMVNNQEIAVIIKTGGNASGGGGVGPPGPTGPTGPTGPAGTNGQSWVPTFTIPVLSEFSWVNQGASTAVELGNRIILSAPAVSGDNWRLLVKSLPAAPWTVTVCLIQDILPSNYQTVGIVLRESGTGKFVSLAGGYNNNFQNIVINFNSPTSYNSFAYQVNSFFVYPQWFRISRAGTALTYYTSLDGYNWRLVLTNTITTFFTTAPDQAGFCVNVNNGAITASMSLLSWSIT